MGNIFLLIFKKITILNSILMIIYCIFDPDIGSFQFLFIIALLLLLSWIIWLTGKILNYFSIKKHSIKKDPQTNNIIQRICLLFSKNIELCYYYSFGVYAIFFLRKYIYLDYFIVLLLGLFIGKRIATRACQYILDQASKKQK